MTSIAARRLEEQVLALPAREALDLVERVRAKLRSEDAGMAAEPTIPPLAGRVRAADLPVLEGQGSPPDDAEVKRWLDERRQERFG